MLYEFPPVENLDKLKHEFMFVPCKDKEDALQESWLAYLEGRDPVQAMITFATREKRHRKRVKHYGTIHDIQLLNGEAFKHMSIASESVEQ